MCIARGRTTLTRLSNLAKFEELEELHLRVFGGSDVVEIFANDRFAWLTKAYSSFNECTSIRCFSTESPPGTLGTTYAFVKIWQGVRVFKKKKAGRLPLGFLISLLVDQHLHSKETTKT